jgi:hypothetical protein
MTITTTFLAKPNKTSSLTVDSDIDMAAYKIKADHLAESTTAHGIVHDNNIVAPKLSVDHLAEKTTSHKVVFDNTAIIDVIESLITFTPSIGGLYPTRVLATNPIAVTVGNTTTPTSLIVTGLTANQITVGSMFRLVAYGRISTKAAGPGTIGFYGVVGGSYTTWTSAALATSLSNLPIMIEILMTCRVAGASGKMMVQTFVTTQNEAAVGTTVFNGTNFSTELDANTTGVLTIAMSMTWSLADVANTITIEQGFAERLI